MTSLGLTKSSDDRLNFWPFCKVGGWRPLPSWPPSSFDVDEYCPELGFWPRPLEDDEEFVGLSGESIVGKNFFRGC